MMLFNFIMEVVILIFKLSLFGIIAIPLAMVTIPVGIYYHSKYSREEAREKVLLLHFKLTPKFLHEVLQ